MVLMFAAVTAKFVSLGDSDYGTVLDGSRFSAVLPYNYDDARHPQFTYEGPARVPNYDVAIIQLQIPVVFANFANARPLCLPSPTVNVVSAEGIVAGWGVLEYECKRLFRHFGISYAMCTVYLY